MSDPHSFEKVLLIGSKFAEVFPLYRGVCFRLLYTMIYTLWLFFLSLFSSSKSPDASVDTTTSGSSADVLIDVFSGIAATPTEPTDLSPGAEDGYKRFITKNNGVLFENDVLQIGVKSEFKKNLGEH